MMKPFPKPTYIVWKGLILRKDRTYKYYAWQTRHLGQTVRVIRGAFDNWVGMIGPSHGIGKTPAIALSNAFRNLKTQTQSYRNLVSDLNRRLS
jgi:hypothetical protein